VDQETARTTGVTNSFQQQMRILGKKPFDPRNNNGEYTVDPQRYSLTRFFISFFVLTIKSVLLVQVLIIFKFFVNNL
jgi:hypothetical protein